MCCASWCRGRRLIPPRLDHQKRQAEFIKAGALGRRAGSGLADRNGCGRSMTCSPNRPANISTAGSRAIWSRRVRLRRHLGEYASPYTPGTAYVLLHHVFGEVNGKKGRLGARDRRHGGDHAGDGAMRGSRCRDPDREPVREVLIEGSRVGVVLEDGRNHPPRRGRANVNPKLLYTGLIPDGAPPADFLRACRHGDAARAPSA